MKPRAQRRCPRADGLALAAKLALTGGAAPLEEELLVARNFRYGSLSTLSVFVPVYICGKNGQPIARDSKYIIHRYFNMATW